ncbi:MAG TPA: hypothetical protein VLN08_10740, partial [Vicinamibacterales bacterium]|nr:hypothetical protein [Vicinamibacterales bacterium]
MTTYEVKRRIITVYDKGGVPLQQHVHSTTTKPSIYELVDPSTFVRLPGTKVAIVVREEHEVDRR